MIGLSSRFLVVLCLLAVFVSAAVDQCKPIGWATRSGRSSTAFEVTGGGDATPITVKTFNDLQKYAKDSSPRVIYIDGTLGDGWSGTSGSRLNITASNKTIIGLKPGTLLKAPIHITNKASNIIIRNIVIKGPGSNANQAWDNLTIEGSAKNIWIDHCEFWDGQDGNADVVKGSDNVTFTWCIFGYEKKSTHNLSNLIGSSDNEPESEGKLNVTYMFNWWKAANQRKPRCRYGNVHVVNNLFPIYTGNDKYGTGVNEVIDNIFTNCTGNTTGTGTSFTPPYEYTSFMLKASEVEAVVRANAGATLASPTECDANYVEPPSPTPERMYQVEKGIITEGILESSNSGFHGDGYVNFYKGGDVVVNVKVDTAGLYRFDIDFANGSSEARSLAIDAGLGAVTQEFNTTGAWTAWETKEVLVALAAGENTVQFSTIDGNDGPNIDQFDITLVEKSGEVPEALLHPVSQGMVKENGLYGVTLFNTKGVVVRHLDVETAKIDDTAWMTHGLPAGIYILRVRSEGRVQQHFVAVK